MLPDSVSSEISHSSLARGFRIHAGPSGPDDSIPGLISGEVVDHEGGLLECSLKLAWPIPGARDVYELDDRSEVLSPDGRFTIANAGNGYLSAPRLLCMATGYAPRLFPVGDARTVVCKLFRGTVLQGDVIASDGRPLPGVTLRLLDWAAWSHQDGWIHCATSDDQGHFAFPLAVDDGEWRVTAELDGFAMTSQQNVVVEPNTESQNLTVKMSVADTLSLVIVDKSRNPLRWAFVYLRDIANQAVFFQGLADYEGRLLTVRPRATPEVPVEVGLAAPAGGAIRWVPDTIPWGGRSVIVVDESAAQLRITVLDAEMGVPIERYAVRLSHLPVDKAHTMAPRLVGWHPGGATFVSGLTHGRYALQIIPLERQWYPSPYIAVVLHEGATVNHEVRVGAAWNVIVKVADTRHDPIPGVRVELIRGIGLDAVTPVFDMLWAQTLADAAEQAKNPVRFDMAQTSPDGVAALRMPPEAGAYALRMVKKGWPTIVVDNVRIAAATHYHSVEMPRPGRLSVMATHVGGNRPQIVLQHAERDKVFRPATWSLDGGYSVDDNGQCTITDVEEGVWLVRVKNGGWLEKEVLARATVAAEKTTDVAIDLSAMKNGVVTVEVTDERGAYLDGWYASLYRKEDGEFGQNPRATTTLDRGGQWHSQGLRAGNYKLVVCSPQSDNIKRLSERWLTVGADQTLHERVTVRRYVVSIVLVDHGVLLANEEIRVVAPEDNIDIGGRTDEKGRFWLDNGPSCDWTCEVVRLRKRYDLTPQTDSSPLPVAINIVR